MSFTFTDLITLADGNQFRFRDDPTGFAMLAVKIGAAAVQEVKLSQAEAQKISAVIQLAVLAKGKDA